MDYGCVAGGGRSQVRTGVEGVTVGYLGTPLSHVHRSHDLV